MTDQKQTFTHISVNDGSDDDIVIQAGAPAVASKAARRVNVSADHADIEDGEEAADVSLGEDVSDEVEEDASYDEMYDEDVWSEADEAEEVDDSDDFEDATYVYEDEPHEVESAPSQAKKDTYHETTLEDLEDISMSSMQKVVLGVVLAIIAVAVVYFVFFMK